MQLPHRLGIRSSNFLTAVLILLYLSVLFSLAMLPVPGWLKIGLAIATIRSGYVALRSSVLQVDPASVQELLLKTDGTLEGLLVGGQRFEATVGKHSTVLPWLVVMQLEHASSRGGHALMLLPDSLPPEDFRLLLSWLRWKVT